MTTRELTVSIAASLLSLAAGVYALLRGLR